MAEVSRSTERKEGKGRTIVVAVDEGEESMYALSWCLGNVVTEDCAGDTLILLYAMPHRAIHTPPIDSTGYLFSEEMVESMESYGKAVADAVIEKAIAACEKRNVNMVIETKVEKGDAREVICDTVEKVHADLLVLGSHGYGLLRRAFLGSVSNHCAQNAKCPVLIVKRPHDSKH